MKAIALLCSVPFLVTVACRVGDQRDARVTELGGCELVLRLECATRDSDPIIRRAAVYQLGRRGPGTSIEAIECLIRDPNEEVRRTAIEAAQSLMNRCGTVDQKASECFIEALQDASSTNRAGALDGLADCRQLTVDQVNSVRKGMDDSDALVQIAAANALQHLGALDGLEARAVALIGQNALGPLDYLLAPLLNCIHDPSNLPTIERLLASRDPSVRYEARCASARLGGSSSDTRDQPALEAEWESETSAAEAALRHEPWHPIATADVLRTVKSARLVMYGEMHVTGGALREGQCRVLRAFSTQPKFEALGYEPSVEAAQHEVIDLARALGMKVIPLESDWVQLVAKGRLGAREVQVIAAIDGFLRENPLHRMLVLRGEAHVLPRGYLDHRLTQEPVIILSGMTVPPSLCLCGLHCDGTAFESSEMPRVFMLPCDDQSVERETDALSQWCATHALQH